MTSTGEVAGAVICRPCQEGRHFMCEGGACECPRRASRMSIQAQLDDIIARLARIEAKVDAHTQDALESLAKI